MRLIQWGLIVTILLASTVFSISDENFQEIVEDTKFEKFMLESNGMLMVLEAVIVDEEGNPVTDKRVNIVCQHGDREHRIFTVITDENGYAFDYRLNLQEWECGEGDTVYGEYRASPKHRTKLFKVEKAIQQSTPLLHIGSVAGVPEYGTITLALAAVGTLAGLMFMRK